MSILSRAQERIGRSDRRRGQGLVEFALILPLLLVMTAGIIEFGRLLTIYNGVSNASREAARYGSVVGDPGNGAGAYYLDCAGMRAAAKRTAVLVTLADANITIVYDHGSGSPFATCTQGVQPTPAIVNGDRVVVTVTASYAPILPLLPVPAQTLTFSAARSIFPNIAGGPACSDGVDNDLDGLIDFPADPNCPSSAGPSEGLTTCYTLTTNVNPSGAGSVSANPTSNCAGGKYTTGTNVILTESPNAGYTFTNWTDGGGSVLGTGPTLSVTMNADKTVNANFSANCYTLTKNVSPSGAGSVSANPASSGGCASGQYTYNTVVTLTAAGSPGYNFSSWSGDLTGSSNPAALTMDGNKNVTANFVSVPCYTLTTGVASGSGSVGAPNPAPNCNTQYNSGTNVTLTAIADPGYVFNNWTDAGGSVLSTSNPVTVTMDADKTYKANFITTTCFSLTLNAGSGGTASRSPAPDCGSNYLSGTVVTLTAIPSTGYSFSSWSGSVTGSANPVNVTMDANKSVTANFTANCYTLTKNVSPSGAGSVSANPASSGGCASGQYTYNTVVTLTAGANAGYTFSSWSGALSGSANPQNLTMPASNTSVTANFIANCVSASAMTSSGSTVTVNYTNNTGALRNITKIVLSWPGNSSKKLNLVTFGGSTLWSGNSTSPVTITSFGTGNTGLSNGTTKALVATFNFTVAGNPGLYKITTTFNDGCTPVTVSGNF